MHAPRPRSGHLARPSSDGRGGSVRTGLKVETNFRGIVLSSPRTVIILYRCVQWRIYGVDTKNEFSLTKKLLDFKRSLAGSRETAQEAVPPLQPYYPKKSKPLNVNYRKKKRLSTLKSLYLVSNAV